MAKNDIDLYLAAVRKKLVGSRKQKHAVLSQLSADIEAFAESCGGEPAMKDLEAEFGTPDEVSETFLQQLRYSEYKKRISAKRIWIIFGVIFAVILIIFGYYFCQMWWKYKHPHGYVEESPVYIVERIEDEELPEGAQVY